MNRQLQSIGSLMCGAKVIVLLLLLCTFAAAQDTAPISALEVKYRRQILKNDRVSVFLLEIPPNHASLMHRHDTDMLAIFVAGGETKSTIYGNPPKEDKCANPFFLGMQEKDWNGEGYTIKHPYVNGAEITYEDQEWVYNRSKSGAAIPPPREFRHTLSALTSGLVEQGFIIQHGLRLFQLQLRPQR